MDDLRERHRLAQERYRRRRGQRPRPDAATRFWTKVDRRGPDGCWLWLGTRSSSGYGQFRLSPSMRGNAHRSAYCLLVGPIPDGLEVCHRCDNRLCVNPSHLFLGSPRDNAQDCIAKGRKVVLRGEDSPKAQLRAVDVAAIRSRYASGGVTQRALAAEFGVSQATISLLARGLTWADSVAV
jgi:hypothetical protein